MDDLLMDANLFSKQRLLNGINGGHCRGLVFGGLQALILEHVPKTANRKAGGYILVPGCTRY